MTSSFSAKLREEQAARLRDETSISRAAKNALSYTPTVSVTANSISFGGAYRSNVQVSDSDDDGEGYDIEPTANIYRREGGPSKLTSHIKKDAIDNLRKDVLGDMLDPPPSSSSSSSSVATRSTAPTDPNIPPPSLYSSNNGPMWLSADDSSESKPQHSSSRGPRLNRSAVAAALDDDCKTTKQVEDLRKDLAQKEKDKRLAEVQASIQAKEKEDEMRTEMDRKERELASMMEAVRKEKEELELHNELAREEADKKAASDLNRLHEALDMMQAQNQMLKNRMEQTQLEAQEAIEKERSERANAIFLMEMENEKLSAQLFQNKLDAERQLANEKDELRTALKRMEIEKDTALHRISETEKQAKFEAELLEQQKQETHEKLEAMASEKEQLAALAKENEAKAKDANETLSATLAQERETIRIRLEKMEAEKKELANDLTKTEQEAKQHAEELRLQLVKEKDSLQESIEKMEKEKKDMAEHLKVTEQSAKEQTEKLNEQIKREKETLKAQVDRMEAEKVELAKKLATNEDEIEKSRQEKENLNKMVKENEKRAEDAEKSVALALEKERDELKERIAKMESESQSKLKAEHEELMMKAKEMADEKEELDSSVKRQHEQEIAREKAAAAKLQKEKDDLIQAVQRMKDELEKERAGKLAAAVEIKETQGDRSQDIGRINSDNDKKKTLKAPLTPEEALNSANKMEMLSSPTTSPKREKREAVDNPFDIDLEPTSPMISPHTSLYEMLERGSSTDESKDAAEKSELKKKGSMAGDKMKEKIEALKAKSAKASGSPNTSPEAIKKLEKKQSMRLHHDMTTIKEDSIPEEVRSEEEEKKAEMERIKEELVGLPAPHTAAALGELVRLQGFANVETSLLASYDSDHRTPIFYAAAYAQVEVMKFLLSVSAGVILEQDVHGDTALHAATSVGSAECIKLISEANKKSVHVQNEIGMTPCHLARDAESLAILYQQGADLTVSDKNGRSPLFVACAMNRGECAEYLIDCLDSDETSLVLKDSRGDTPLHASACNGSVDCLLLLLQHGVDPLILNDKGLKAIDLAIRNKKSKCRELLAEYHLHFCTASTFDSVLFLATLEGHRMVKSSVGGSGSEQYDIIKKRTSPSLSKTRSMYSLNHTKSLRLQRWGSWIAYEDQENKEKTYWYNQRTGQGQWEKPEKVIAIEKKELETLEKHGEGSLAVSILPKKASMRLKRVGDWIQYLTETGQTFYYNEKNGEFQWVDPESTSSGNDKLVKKRSQATDADASKGLGRKMSSKMSFDMKSWKPYKDPETGSLFWYNSKTQISQWECPFDEIEELKEDPNYDETADRMKQKEENEDDDDAIEVLDEDDLGI